MGLEGPDAYLLKYYHQLPSLSIPISKPPALSSMIGCKQDEKGSVQDACRMHMQLQKDPGNMHDIKAAMPYS